MEGLAGLWCNALGFGNEELVETAANQMQKYGYGSLFASKSHEPAIMLSEKLMEMSPFDNGKVFLEVQVEMQMILNINYSLI